MPRRDLQSFAWCVKLYICSWICHVILKWKPEGAFLCLWLHSSWCGSGTYSVIFKFQNVEMYKITLMFPDPVPLSSAIWGDRSGEGTSQEGVRVNFPRLGLGPSLSSYVTVLGFSLEKPAVAILAVVPGQSRRHHSMKMWKTGFGLEYALQQVPGAGRQAMVISENLLGWINKNYSDDSEFQPYVSILSLASSYLNGFI